MNQRRKWNAGERVRVTAPGGTFDGTVVGEHLDGPLVQPDVDPDGPRRPVYYRDANLLRDSLPKS